MVGRSNNIEKIRKAIDAVDDDIHDLLMRRVELTEKAAAANGGSGGSGARLQVQPGREAQLLRRLIARHGGSLPAASVARLWRELVAAMQRLQGEFTVAVCAPVKSVGYWDLARNHFGSATPMSLHRSPQLVIHAVAEQSGCIGILPLPEVDEADPWWPLLASTGGEAPSIIARLPFLDDGTGRFEDLGALVIASCPPDPSGDDHSLLALLDAQDISRDRLHQILDESGLSTSYIAGTNGGGPADGRLHLVKVEGYVAASDPRLDDLMARAEGVIAHIRVLGSYAQPCQSA